MVALHRKQLHLMKKGLLAFAVYTLGIYVWLCLMRVA